MSGSLLSRSLQTLDAAIAGAQRGLRRRLGRRVEPRLVGYRGWATREHAVVLGRVVEDDLDAREQLRRVPRLLRVAYERFATLGAAGAPVRVEWKGQQVRATSDAGGFVDVVSPGGGGPPGEVGHALLALDGSSARAEIYPVPAEATLGVISDIDDTVLETELDHPIGRALQLVYSEERMRLPFDGIAALYQAFTTRGSPIFYVSNAPWNLYQHVVELLDHHEIPKGPVLLRDQGLGERPPRGGGVHKQAALRRIVEDCRGLSFVLLGDSSRRDPLRYVEVAEQHPGRVAAIYIREVSGLLARREKLDHLKARAAEAGVELLVAGDTVTIARHAASRGFVPRSEVEHVADGKREDERMES